MNGGGIIYATKKRFHRRLSCPSIQAISNCVLYNIHKRDTYK